VRQMQRDIERARQLLAQRRSDLGELMPLAQRLTGQADRHPEQAGEIHFLVGSMYARIGEHDPAGALLDAWSNARLHLEEAQTLRGELLLELKRHEEARKVLAHVGIEAPPAVVAKARYLRALSFQEEQLWGEAETRWREALDDRVAPPREPARIFYNLGICCRKQNKNAEAASAWTQCADRGDAGEVGPAALGELGDLQLCE